MLFIRICDLLANHLLHLIYQVGHQSIIVHFQITLKLIKNSYTVQQSQNYAIKYLLKVKVKCITCIYVCMYVYRKCIYSQVLPRVLDIHRNPWDLKISPKDEKDHTLLSKVSFQGELLFLNKDLFSLLGDQQLLISMVQTAFHSSIDKESISHGSASFYCLEPWLTFIEKLEIGSFLQHLTCM